MVVMQIKNAFIPVIIGLVMFYSCNEQQDTGGKVILYKNAKIWTGDSSNLSASCIAIRGESILYVGSNSDSIKADSVVDLQGRMIVPGFIDNHTHFLSGGCQLNAVDLRKAKTKNQFIAILNDYITANPGVTWIQGGDWDHEVWGGELPVKEWIDSITGNRPVFLSRYDGHMALANSAALKLAGIDKNTKSPDGGEIIKDTQSGEPGGVLKDDAMGLVYNKIPDPTSQQLDKLLQRATGHAHKNGVTQVHDMGSYGGWIDLETYRRAYTNQTLGIRIYSFVSLSTWQKLADYVKQNGKGDDLLRWGGLKGFVDGSLGSTTAWFYKPYLDAPKSTGLVLNDTNVLRKWILNASAEDLQVAVHAIGDRANDWLLTVFEEAKKINGKQSSRFRIEHAQHLSESAIPKFALLNVIPSMQPYHAIDDGRWAAKRLEDDRLKRTYAFKSLLDANAKLTFGSDWTVAPLTPLEGIYAAVTRKTLDDKNPDGWYPEEKITVEQALRCYTINNAYAGFQENKLGMLKAGMLADFVVLSDDLFSIPAEKIRDAKVLKTISNGKLVYNSNEYKK